MTADKIAKYYPTLDSARIRDSTPKAMGSRLLEGESDSNSVMDGVLDETDPSRRMHEAVPGSEVIGGEYFMAHIALMQDITADVPEVQEDEFIQGSRPTYDSDLPEEDFALGVMKYVDTVYKEDVGFDADEDISVESYRDGEVRLSVDLHYEPDVEFLDGTELPGALTVSGEVNEEYREELEEV